MCFLLSAPPEGAPGGAGGQEAERTTCVVFLPTVSVAVAGSRTASYRPSMAVPRVVALALDGLVTFDLACATQVFGGAGRAPPHPLYGFAVCGVRRGRVATSDGL